MGQVSKEKLRNLKRQTNLKAEKSTRSQTVSIPKKQEVKNRRTNPSKSHPILKRKEIRSPRRKATNWHWHWSHPYLMTAFTFLIALTVALLHGLDLLVEWPFHGAVSYTTQLLVFAVSFSLLCVFPCIVNCQSMRRRLDSNKTAAGLAPADNVLISTIV